MITVSAFEWVPDFAKGLVRDLPVRWALEEAGIPYQTKTIDLEVKQSPEYKSWQPFGQVPAFDDGQIRMFESGAIVLHIAEKSDALMPSDPAGRARATTWMFAAVNSIDPVNLLHAFVTVFNADAPWAKEARGPVLERVKKRLDDLSAYLKGREWLEDRFTAGDLMMACVLRPLRGSGLVDSDPVLGPYVKRCEARPAFQRALAAQLADFTGQPKAA